MPVHDAYERGVTTLTLDSPHNRNALSDAAELAERSARLFASAEAREGMAAFLEKRNPAWAR